jgi:hypothetical protein
VTNLPEPKGSLKKQGWDVTSLPLVDHQFKPISQKRPLKSIRKAPEIGMFIELRRVVRAFNNALRRVSRQVSAFSRLTGAGCFRTFLFLYSTRLDSRSFTLSNKWYCGEWSERTCRDVGNKSDIGNSSRVAHSRCNVCNEDKLRVCDGCPTHRQAELISSWREVHLLSKFTEGLFEF